MTDYFKMMQDVAGSYGEGVGIARDRQYQDERRARETTQFNQQQEEYNRAQGLQRKVDSAHDNLESLSAGVVDPGATGLSQPSAQMLSQGYGGAKGPQAVQDAAGDYQREASRMGMAPQHNAQAPVTRRKASEREMLDARMGVAEASRDMTLQGVYREQGKELDWNDGRQTHGKAWDALTDAQRLAQVDKLSLDAGIPGNGTWVPGVGNRAGYMWYTPPGKEPVKLSNKEAKELYTLANLSEVNPERARKETEAAGDKVRSVYNHLFEVQTKGVTANNTGQHYMDDATHKKGVLAETGRHNQAREGLMRDSVENKAPREADPALVAKSNDLYAEYEAASPKDRAGIERKWNMVQSQIATSLGKPMQLRSEGKAPLAPEAQQKYRDARQEMGLERPPTNVGAWFGGKDDSKGVAWDSRLKNLNALYGVATPGAAGGSATDQAMARYQAGGAAATTTPTTGMKPQVPGRVLSEAAPTRGFLGLGDEEATYNVERPDGTTQMLSASEMKQLGYPMESMMGRMRYSPNYK